MSASLSPRDLALAVSVPIIWGLGFTFSKAALDEFPPIFLMACRFALTAVTLVWFVRPPLALLRRIAVIAFISATVQYSLTFTGLEGLDASTAVLLVQLEVPCGVLLATVLLREHLGLERALGIVLTFIGVLMFSGEPRIAEHLGSVAMVLGGVFTWALGQVMIRKLGPVGGFTLIAWVAVMATPQLFVCSFVFEDGQMEALANATWVGWGTIVYLGIVMTALGYGIWYHLLGRFDVNVVMPFLLLLPVVSIVAGVVLLGESLTPPLVVGGIMVLCGVAIIVTYKPPKTTLGDAREP